MAATEHVCVHVVFIHAAGPTQDAERRRPAAGQNSESPSASLVAPAEVHEGKHFFCSCPLRLDLSHWSVKG